VAKEAATVSAKVADHSFQMTEHAKSALEHAHDALHRARVDSDNLSQGQRDSLKKAEKQLREATKRAEYGQVKDADYVKADVDNKKLKKLEDKMDRVKDKQESSEIEEMRKELEELRNRLKKKSDKSDDEALKELEKKLEELEAAEKKEDKVDAKSHDEMKAEIERLREKIDSMEEAEEGDAPEKVEKAKEVENAEADAAPVEKEGLDVDTDMPYGDLEPFGREDTAQELTEDSIKESDEMVDQLERAEIAEEKRAVFRALTRLRGAAITSFDGVARTQTGNIDEYNRRHQWRDTHPVRHLADEESDVNKWAFPDNADFIQKSSLPKK